jgi:hypothetical protein
MWHKYICVFYFWLPLNVSSAEKLGREVALLMVKFKACFKQYEKWSILEMNVNCETINVIFIILFIFSGFFNLSYLNMIPKFKTI